MRLTDLEAMWLERKGKKIAIMFLCPHCFPAKRQWLTCFFIKAGDLPPDKDGMRGERRIFEKALQAKDEPNPERAWWDVVGCQPNIAWTKDSDDLETISIVPSLDASPAGHWHGFIQKGMIVGGI